MFQYPILSCLWLAGAHNNPTENQGKLQKQRNYARSLKHRTSLSVLSNTDRGNRGAWAFKRRSLINLPSWNKKAKGNKKRGKPTGIQEVVIDYLWYGGNQPNLPVCTKSNSLLVIPCNTSWRRGRRVAAQKCSWPMVRASFCRASAAFSWGTLRRGRPWIQQGIVWGKTR